MAKWTCTIGVRSMCYYNYFYVVMCFSIVVVLLYSPEWFDDVKYLWDLVFLPYVIKEKHIYYGNYRKNFLVWKLNSTPEWTRNPLQSGQEISKLNYYQHTWCVKWLIPTTYHQISDHFYTYLMVVCGNFTWHRILSQV